ncbi:MAG: hypothetical protein ACRYG7_14255 [Janthinobacterium lividum]
MTCTSTTSRSTVKLKVNGIEHGTATSGGRADGGNIIGGGAGATWANDGTVDIAGFFTTTNVTDADYTKTMALIRNKTGVQ